MYGGKSGAPAFVRLFAEKVQPDVENKHSILKYSFLPSISTA
jgi:hypothetical protein